MTLRTYWHLEELHRKPSDYEVASSRLLWHPAAGLEVQTPLAEWFRKYQSGSPLVLADAERFADPRETTYTSYTSIQKDREIYVDGLLRSMEEPEYDRSLSPAWLSTLSKVLVPLRYPAHGLQMAAAYLGHVAPGGRIVIAALFQAADEIRRIQRLAYRQALLRSTRPGFGAEAKQAWEEDPLWQPLRRLVEELLVAYDWGESFAALNLVVKPVFDQCFLVHFAETATRCGDPLLGRMLHSLNEDSLWHRQWSSALVRRALQDREGNRSVLGEWISRWAPRAREAISPFERLLAAAGADPRAEEPASRPGRLWQFAREYWSSLTLPLPLER